VQKTDFVSALEAQADNLRVTARVVADALEAADLAPWLADETVAVVAMGASSHAGEGLVAALAAEGVRAVNVTASDLDLTPEGFQPGDHYVVISESGRSPEPIRAAGRIAAGCRIGITNDPRAPLAATVDTVVPLGGWADSPVYTTGFTGTLLAFAALVRHQRPSSRITHPGTVPDLVAGAVTDLAGRADQAARLLETVSAVDVVARGVSHASAAEGALLLREGTRLHAAAYDTFQYLHGPMESLGQGSGLIVFGGERELNMIDTVLDHGVKVVLLTQAAEEDIPRSEHENLLVVPLEPELRDIGRAVVETVFVQLLALRHCTRAGIDIDEFRYDQPDTKLPEESHQ
jgi:glucosamine--fructose-6-phosphate aminotransferase (isomerizing)